MSASGDDAEILKIERHRSDLRRWSRRPTSEIYRLSKEFCRNEIQPQLQAVDFFEPWIPSAIRGLSQLTLTRPFSTTPTSGDFFSSTPHFFRKTPTLAFPTLISPLSLPTTGGSGRGWNGPGGRVAGLGLAAWLSGQRSGLGTIDHRLPWTTGFETASRGQPTGNGSGEKFRSPKAFWFNRP